MILRTIFKHYLSSALKYIPFYNSNYPGSIYLFEVNNENIGTTCEICSNLTIKTLNIFRNLLYCFYTCFEQVKTSWVLRAGFTDKTKAFFHLLKLGANTEAVTHRRWEICEDIKQLKSVKIFYRKQ